jgi:hypothetical protein
MIDNNPSNVAKAIEEGIPAFQGNIFADEIRDNIELNNMGYLMALTGSKDVNDFAINNLKASFGEKGAYRIVTTDEKNDTENNPEEGLFSHTDDYINFAEVARDYPQFHEVTLKGQSDFTDLLNKIQSEESSIPVFIKNSDDQLKILDSHAKTTMKVNEGETLVYMGKKLKGEPQMEVEGNA